MKWRLSLYIFLIGIFIQCNALRAQMPSSCIAPPVLLSNYDWDVSHLVMGELIAANSPYLDSVIIPESYKDTIFKPLSAIFNLTTFPQRDSVFNVYCIHQDVSNYIFRGIDMGVDTSYAWVHNWMHSQTTTGQPRLDSLLSTFGFTITNFLSFGGNYAFFNTTQDINVKALCNDIMALGDSGILYAEATPIAGWGDEINYYTLGSNSYMSFTIGLGDCPSGCTGSYTYHFEVDSSCSVTYLGLTQSNAFPGSLFQRNCNIDAPLCQTTNDSLSHAICAGDTFYLSTKPFTIAGNYTDTLTNVSGCDSIVILMLTVYPINFDTIQHAMCQNDTFYFRNKAYTLAGNYNDTLTNTTGCDSIVTLALTVNPLPVVTLYWDSMIGREGFFAYGSDTVYCHELSNLVWLAGGTPGGGVYSGTAIIGNILYADSALQYLGVRIDTIYYTYTDSNGCTATTSNTVGLYNCPGIRQVSDDNYISIYPNPTSDQLYIKTQGIKPETTTIYDVNGHIVYTMPFKPEIDMQQLSSGVYFVAVKSTGTISRQPFVKM